MNIQETKSLLKKVFTNKLTIVPAVIGPKGIGKTELLKQCAKELNMGYQAVYPSSLQGEDFMGLLEKDKESNITYYLPPDFFPTDNAVKNKLFPEEGLFVIEEFNRADTQTISALFPLLLERKVNNHSLAKGWRMVVSMNPESMEYMTNTIDNAGMDRIMPINVSPDLDEYASYMLNNNLSNDSIMEFLYAHKEMFNQDELKNDMGKSPSPRGWTKTCEVLNAFECTPAEQHQILSGLVGSEASASYIGFLKDRDVEYPDVDKILKNYTKEQQRIVKKIIDSNRYDIMNLTLKRMVIGIDEKDNKHVKNLDKFLGDLNSELQTVFVQQLAKEKKDPMPLLNKMPDKKEQIIQKLMEISTSE